MPSESKIIGGVQVFMHISAGFGLPRILSFGLGDFSLRTEGPGLNTIINSRNWKKVGEAHGEEVDVCICACVSCEYLPCPGQSDPSPSSCSHKYRRDHYTPQHSSLRDRNVGRFKLDHQSHQQLKTLKFLPIIHSGSSSMTRSTLELMKISTVLAAHGQFLNSDVRALMTYTVCGTAV